MRITHEFRKTAVVLTFLLLGLLACSGQPESDFVELVDVIPDVVLDIRYATENNFVGEVLYPSARCFLMREPALALAKVQDDLKSRGYQLKVYDGYRPLSVQKRMWEILPDSRYVADPATGSMHNRGYSVDVALLDSAGNELLMPTPFDDFTEAARQDNMDLPEDAIHHRAILRTAMEKQGFSIIDTEWWHYNYQGARDKPVLDVSIDDLAAAQKSIKK